MATIIDNKNLVTDLVDGKLTSTAVITDPTYLRITTVTTNATNSTDFAIQTYLVDDGNGDADLLDANDNKIEN